MLSRLLLSGTITVLLSASLPLAVQGQASAAPPKAEYPLRDTVDFTVRDGLPNFFAKLKNGGTVKIGYLGGSITAQNGWRIKSREWFQKQYPKAKVEEINAAIGGTGSDLGVFRIDRDVLAGKPDLLFVEFAVNDSGASPDNIRKAMEGIVRKTWKALPDCDICFVYTITERDIKGLQAGKMKRSESVMEELADFYHISSIHLGLEVARLEKEGRLMMKAPEAKVERVSGDELNQTAKLPTDAQGKIAFSNDGVHPYTDTGHALYLAAIIKAMEKIGPAGNPGAHQLSAPLMSNNWEAAKMIPLDQLGKIEGPATKLDPAQNSLGKNFSNRVPSLWQFEPGAVLQFKFKGTKAGIYDLLGPDCGIVEVTLDGKSRKDKRIDGYCTYSRLAILQIGDNMEDKEHEVVLRVLPEAPDKRKILFPQNVADLEKNPAKYAPNKWYPGAIFIIGEPVK